jgi:circadian clock protein KaiC
VAAANRGEHAVIFYARCDALNIPLRNLVETGRISIQQIDPAEMSPGEFVSRVRAAVEQSQARVIVIDTLNGYLNAMPDERFLVLQMHELLSYLNQLGVVTILILAQHGLMGPMQTPLDMSYLSDTVVMLRYFEAEGEVGNIRRKKKEAGLTSPRSVNSD